MWIGIIVAEGGSGWAIRCNRAWVIHHEAEDIENRQGWSQPRREWIGCELHRSSTRVNWAISDKEDIGEDVCGDWEKARLLSGIHFRCGDQGGHWLLSGGDEGQLALDGGGDSEDDRDYWDARGEVQIVRLNCSHLQRRRESCCRHHLAL